MKAFAREVLYPIAASEVKHSTTCVLKSRSIMRARVIIVIQGALRAGTNALSFSASARHVYDYLAANASTVQYEYRTSNRRAPYEYCSRILLRMDKARGDVVYFSYSFVIFLLLFRYVFV